MAGIESTDSEKQRSIIPDLDYITRVYLPKRSQSTITIRNKATGEPEIDVEKGNLKRMVDAFVQLDYTEKYMDSCEVAVNAGQEAIKKWVYDRLAELAFHWFTAEGKIKPEIWEVLQPFNLSHCHLSTQLFDDKPSLDALKNISSEQFPLLIKHEKTGDFFIARIEKQKTLKKFPAENIEEELNQLSFEKTIKKVEKIPDKVFKMLEFDLEKLSKKYDQNGKEKYYEAIRKRDREEEGEQREKELQKEATQKRSTTEKSTVVSITKKAKDVISIIEPKEIRYYFLSALLIPVTQSMCFAEKKGNTTLFQRLLGFFYTDYQTTEEDGIGLLNKLVKELEPEYFFKYTQEHKNIVDELSTYSKEDEKKKPRYKKLLHSIKDGFFTPEIVLKLLTFYCPEKKITPLSQLESERYETILKGILAIELLPGRRKTQVYWRPLYDGDTFNGESKENTAPSLINDEAFIKKTYEALVQLLKEDGFYLTDAVYYKTHDIFYASSNKDDILENSIKGKKVAFSFENFFNKFNEHEKTVESFLVAARKYRKETDFPSNIKEDETYKALLIKIKNGFFTPTIIQHLLTLYLPEKEIISLTKIDAEWYGEVIDKIVEVELKLQKEENQYFKGFYKRLLNLLSQGPSSTVKIVDLMKYNFSIIANGNKSEFSSNTKGDVNQIELDEIYESYLSQKKSEGTHKNAIIDVPRTLITYVVDGVKVGIHGPSHKVEPEKKYYQHELNLEDFSKESYYNFLTKIGIANAEVHSYLFSRLNQTKDGLFFLLSKITSSFFSESKLFEKIIPGANEVTVSWNSKEGLLLIKIDAVNLSLKPRGNFDENSSDFLSFFTIDSKIKISFKGKEHQFVDMDVNFGIENPNKEKLQRLWVVFPEFLRIYFEKTNDSVVAELFDTMEDYSQLFDDMDFYFRNKENWAKQGKNSAEILMDLHQRHSFLKDKKTKIKEGLSLNPHIPFDRKIGRIFWTDSKIVPKFKGDSFVLTKKRDVSFVYACSDYFEKIAHLIPQKQGKWYDMLGLPKIAYEDFSSDVNSEAAAMRQQLIQDSERLRFYAERQKTEEKERLEEIEETNAIRLRQKEKNFLKPLSETENHRTTAMREQLKKDCEKLDFYENRKKEKQQNLLEKEVEVSAIRLRREKYGPLLMRMKNHNHYLELLGIYLERVVGYQFPCRIWVRQQGRVDPDDYEVGCLLLYEHFPEGSSRQLIKDYVLENENLTLLESPYELRHSIFNAPIIKDHFPFSLFVNYVTQAKERDFVFIHPDQFSFLESILIGTDIKKNDIEGVFDWYKTTFEKECLILEHEIDSAEKNCLLEMEATLKALNTRISAKEAWSVNYVKSTVSSFFKGNGDDSRKVADVKKYFFELTLQKMEEIEEIKLLFKEIRKMQAIETGLKEANDDRTQFMKNIVEGVYSDWVKFSYDQRTEAYSILRDRLEILIKNVRRIIRGNSPLIRDKTEDRAPLLLQPVLSDKQKGSPLRQRGASMITQTVPPDDVPLNVDAEPKTPSFGVG